MKVFLMGGPSTERETPDFESQCELIGSRGKTGN